MRRRRSLLIILVYVLCCINTVCSTSISSLVSQQLFDSIFLHKDDAVCPANGFYSYDSFVRATRCFPQFGNTGSLTTRKREIAAFLAQISHETTGGWPTAPDGPYAWGLCFKEEISPQTLYCDSTNTQWPCSPAKSYHGRGPIQLSWYYFNSLLHYSILPLGLFKCGCLLAGTSTMAPQEEHWDLTVLITPK